MTTNELENNGKSDMSQWNFIYVFIIASIAFTALFFAVIDLQLVEGSIHSDRASRNEVELSYEYPKRGVIYDRDGNRLAENVASTNLILKVKDLYEEDQFNGQRLKDLLEGIEGILGENWFKPRIIGEEEYKDPHRYVLSLIAKLEEEDGFYARYSEVELVKGLDNDQTISLKAKQEDLDGLYLEEGSKRNYLGGPEFSHILGYTSMITAEDLQYVDYLGYGELAALNGYRDVIGRVGVESTHDELLIGTKGITAVETDAYGNVVSDVKRTVSPVKNGKNLHLSISSKAQKKMYEILKAAVKEYNATGGAGIIQDVKTGEIIVLVTTPTFNNNDFIGGIEQSKYDKLLKDKNLPLLNRTIAAQLPPGSTFKTLTATGLLESGAINTNTVYVSRADYTFTDGAPFQEYHGKSYGALDVNDAISVSSNIYFCEAIRKSDINDIVPHYENFGIGKPTGVDLEGETAGRLPSPSNKIELAKTPGITWLDPVWYPEGDSCNTVIGQGITLVTPLQMSNWIAAIANGGTLNTPHLGTHYSVGEDEELPIQSKPIRTNIASESTLEVVRTGMRNAVAGPRKSIWALTDSKIPVAAKTGTAEFGALNSKGEYEHTHAWVTGFFPYEDPQYSFVMLLEDGGESYFAAQEIRKFLDWWADETPLE